MSAPSISAPSASHPLVDPSDVPPVCPSALRLALALEWPANHAPASLAALSAGLSRDALARIEANLWRGGPPCAERTSVMLRLMALGDALRGRRFARLANAGDATTVAAALDAAATLRLNARAGLNPVRLMWAITERPDNVTALPVRSSAPQQQLSRAA